MLSIIPFDRLTASSAPAVVTSGTRDSERPFKAYPRTPVTVPPAPAPYYGGPFTPPTFVGSVNIPTNHTSASLKSLNDVTSSSFLTSSSSMDSHLHGGHHAAHVTTSGGYANYAMHSEQPPMSTAHLMDMPGHPSLMRHSAAPSMGMTIPHAPASVKTEEHAQVQPNSSSLVMHHNNAPTPTPPTSLVSASASSSSGLHQTHPVFQPPHLSIYPRGTEAASSTPQSHALPAATGRSPPEPAAVMNTPSSSGGSRTSTESSPESSNDETHAHHPSRVPPKKRPHNVPAEAKDETYWEKRRKNNESAKRSRDARRAKEEMLASRLVCLEEENVRLNAECQLYKREVASLRSMLYEDKGTGAAPYY